MYLNVEENHAEIEKLYKRMAFNGFNAFENRLNLEIKKERIKKS